METSVLVVGAGPCGATIANLLGTYGVDTVVIDRAADIVDYPRGVGIDDESLRVFQSAGLAETVHRDMIQDQALRYFDAAGRPLVTVAPAGRPFGWPRRNSFLQPMLEAHLRQGLKRFDGVELLTEHTLMALSQDGEGAAAVVTDAAGRELLIRAQYVVGADGGRSTVRSLLGVQMDGTTLPSRWLVVDVPNTTHHAPYSGNYISRTRPHVSIDLPYGYRRFEFRLTDDETDAMMLRPEAVGSLIREHFAWGPELTGDERIRIYSHHSRVADRFQVGRVFLAGDAAHLQPPWFGQGLNSGIRDAANISWKLAAALRHAAGPEAMLRSYEEERRGHAQAMVELATMLGKIYSPKTRLGELVRSVGLRLANRVPTARDYILQMKFKPMPYYEKGIVLHDARPGSPVGRMFIQPDVETDTGTRVKLDDVLGPWFSVVGVNFDPAEHLSPVARDYWRRLGARFIRINRSRAGVHLRSADPETLLVDDVQGGLRDWVRDRPSCEAVVIRPDRYVAAACTREELEKVTSDFGVLFPVTAQGVAHV